MNSQSATHSAFQLSLKNLLWALPILFLSFFQSQTSYAQTILIANGQAINVCSDSTVENITLLYAGAITRTNQRCTIQLPLGVLYISGSLTGTGGLAVSQFDISDLNRPIFAVANDPSGFNLSTFNFRRKANCDAAATGQDQITLTGTNTPGGNYVVNGNSNTYNINRAAFNFNSTLTGPFTIGSSVCRPIVIDNSGNGTIDRIYYSVDISDRISNYSLFLNNVELVAITETPTFNGVLRTYQLDNVDFDAGETL
ncbi:MAG: hypothetical protein ABIV51_11610, partial [Saprospiraceae bacterium]